MFMLHAYIYLFVTAVTGRQVDVTRDELPEVEEGLLAEHLGHHVRQLFLGRDVDDLDRPMLDMFTEEMMPDVDVFRALK